jgi:hypothetical protein
VANPNPELHPENLIPVKPGEVRNPNGSSRKQRLTNALLKHFDDNELDLSFIKAGAAEALGGDFNFWKYIFERIDGKIPEPEPEKTGEDAIKEKLRERRAKRQNKDG